MATELFSISYDAGATLRFAIFRLSDGYVLDWNGTPAFKTLGSATTPYVSATELTDLAGTGKSTYKASVDLSKVNSSSTPAQYVVDWYTDTSLTARISESLGIKVASSALTTGDGFTVPTTEPTGPLSATATPAEIMAWLNLRLRDKVEVTNSEIKYYNDAGTQIAKSAISDDGTKFSAAKVSTP